MATNDDSTRTAQLNTRWLRLEIRNARDPVFFVEAYQAAVQHVAHLDLAVRLACKADRRRRAGESARAAVERHVRELRN